MIKLINEHYWNYNDHYHPYYRYWDKSYKRDEAQANMEEREESFFNTFDKEVER